MFGLTRRRREKLRRLPFPDTWRYYLKRRVPLYLRLPGEDRRELEGLIQVFLGEKRFEGCGGFALTDEVRVVIAAQACLLLLHRETGYYPGLSSVVVYPTSFIVERSDYDEIGIITEETGPLVGESWDSGCVVLAWDEVLDSSACDDDGYNVVIHEFAHQLDAEDGITDGAPSLPDLTRHRSWARVFGDEYRRLREMLESDGETMLDEYGASDPAEFFAVVTESFFEMPEQLKGKHPELYDELSRYYRQDPAGWQSSEEQKVKGKQ
jgi:hypothetical protein